MKINLDKLNKLKEDGWLMSQVHPTLPLTIWNYTNKTQWEGYWTEITLMCRALITDSDGNIVAYPLKKFFNYGELAAEGAVPTGDYKMYKKMDGSLIQLFNYNGHWVVSSRGSFTSDHAQYAAEILNDKYPIYDTEFDGLEEDCNYIFELIHPDTRIVVDYGEKRDLILLAVIDKDGVEKNIKEYANILTLVEEVQFYSVDIETGDQPIIYDTKHISDWESVKMLVEDDEEGYVIKFASGERMKIKGDEYCRLHRIVTMTSSYDIWETLRDNKDITELLERAPDEWLAWVYKTIGEIYVEYKKIHQQIEKDWNYGMIDRNLYYIDMDTNRWTINPYFRRGDIAQYINTCQFPALMFNKLDGLDYDKKVWELCKPAHSKAFSI